MATKNCIICKTDFTKPLRQRLDWWRTAKYCGQECYKKRVISEETREKMRKHMKGNKYSLGFKHSEETRRHRAMIWQIKREAGLFKSPKPNPRANRKYKEWRLTILERDNFTCTECGIQGKSARLEIDHIKPFRDFPELRFESMNVRTLCRECHKKTDTYGVKVFTYGASF